MMNVFIQHQVTKAFAKNLRAYFCFDVLSSLVSEIRLLLDTSYFNPLHANPTEWWDINNSSAFADELFECV